MKTTDRWEETRKLYQTKRLETQEPKFKYYNSFLKILRGLNIKPTKRHRTLEVGGGGFPFTQVIDQKSAMVIDPFQEPRYSDKHHYVFKKLKVEDLSVKENFDFIFSLNVIDHVDDIDSAVTKIASLLKPKGKLVIILNTYYQEGLQRFFQKYNRHLDRPHPYHFTKTQFAKLMRRHGLKLVKFVPEIEKKINAPWDISKQDKFEQIKKDPLLLVRIAIIRLSVLFTGKPFRPAHLYVFEPVSAATRQKKTTRRTR